MRGMRYEEMLAKWDITKLEDMRLRVDLSWLVVLRRWTGLWVLFLSLFFGRGVLLGLICRLGMVEMV